MAKHGRELYWKLDDRALLVYPLHMASPPNKAAEQNTDPDDPDTRAFREAINGVRRLQHNRRPLPPRRPKAGRPRPAAAETDAQDQAHTSTPESLILETGEELHFKRPGLPAATFRRLRRGLQPIDGELDLHGYNSHEAQHELARFLHEAQQCGARCLRIIHGRGLGSRHGPVLKRKLAAWLQLSPEVLAYVTAIPAHGGNGAVYVLLRKQ